MPSKKVIVKSADNRIIYFDYLRVFAIVAVVFLHVAASQWGTVNINSANWHVFNAFDSIMRWGVSAFVMISGALFLGKETKTKVLYKKYIFRLLIAYFAWSIIYALIIGKAKSPLGFLLLVVKGHYHLWFLPMIIGLYMCVPLIKPIVKKKDTMKYFLLLSLIFAYIIPEFSVITSTFFGGAIGKAVGAISSFVTNMNIKMVLGYTGLFVLGYYLSEKKLEKKQRYIIYICGILCALATVILSIAATQKAQIAKGVFYDNFTVNVLIMAIAVFVWFKYRNYRHQKINKLVATLSKYSFGVYLVHVLVLNRFYVWTNLSTTSFAAILSVPTFVILAIVISFAISAILNHIPIIKKYIV